MRSSLRFLLPLILTFGCVDVSKPASVVECEKGGNCSDYNQKPDAGTKLDAGNTDGLVTAPDVGDKVDVPADHEPDTSPDLASPEAEPAVDTQPDHVEGEDLLGPDSSEKLDVEIPPDAPDSDTQVTEPPPPEATPVEPPPEPSPDGSVVRDAGTCVEQIKANGYAWTGVPACSACAPNGMPQERKCIAMIDCFISKGSCISSSCVMDCRNQAAADMSVSDCATALTGAACK